VSIIHRYILKQFLRNFGICLLAFSMLFLMVDFFDRIDNVLSEGAPFGLIFSYFLFKIPLIISLMLPLAMLVSTLLTIGLLSKNSELTAMRASGLTVFWIARPIFISALLLSLFALLLNETIVPDSQRRVREIYNLDIRQRDARGAYSQTDFWWRSQDTLYSVGIFDSRTNTLHDFSKFKIDETFQILERVDAPQVTWVDPILGWTMNNVVTYRFLPEETVVNRFNSLPLPISETPADFFDTERDPFTMSYGQLDRFIGKQMETGVSVSGYLADLYAKISFPFVVFIVTLVALPFALRPARSGSLAVSFLAGLIIGFSYYAVHSFSVSMGRAELWNPLLAAWMANIVMGFVGLILNLGAESPA